MTRAHRVTLRAVATFLAMWAMCTASMGLAELTREQRAHYDRWLVAAERAEQAIAAERASNAAFEALRAELAGFRQSFVGASDRNSERLRRLQDQLQALGPAPEDGQVEAEYIANLRAQLTTRIKETRVPVVLADEGHSRANGLIAEIDRIIRTRRARGILGRVQTPLTPALWPQALQEVEQAVQAIVNETIMGWMTARNLNTIRDNLPVILLSAILGLWLVLRGGHWSERLGV
ncbi:MAG: DUF3772 domain-containing protein, partial [Rhodobacteraceae bacterium]|nr:DUF3772 domain-containing protein [Paracoccaceae bacterium]